MGLIHKKPFYLKHYFRRFCFHHDRLYKAKKIQTDLNLFIPTNKTNTCPQDKRGDRQDRQDRSEKNYFCITAQNRLTQYFVTIGIEAGSYNVQFTRFSCVAYATQITPIANHMDLTVSSIPLN